MRRSGVRHLQRKFCKVRANRPPRCGHLPPETRNEYVPIGSSKTSLFLKVSVGRYPHPGLGRWILSGFSSSWGRQPPHGWAAKVLLGVRRWWEGDGLPGPCETGVEKEPTRTYLWRVLVSHYPPQLRHHGCPAPRENEDKLKTQGGCYTPPALQARAKTGFRYL